MLNAKRGEVPISCNLPYYRSYHVHLWTACSGASIGVSPTTENFSGELCPLLDWFFGKVAKSDHKGLSTWAPTEVVIALVPDEVERILQNLIYSSRDMHRHANCADHISVWDGIPHSTVASHALRELSHNGFLRCTSPKLL